MPRQARKLSSTGIYHVMLRGINQQQIFEDEEDYDKFLQILKECKEVSEFRMLAYCLMGNHVHLLIKQEQERLDTVFRRIAGRYVYWYNVKYRRVGHLFQDRFKSEPVEDDAYFLTVLRYIHRNPVKAKMCRKPEDYLYSSYREYIGEESLIDRSMAENLLPPDQFIAYHNEEANDGCMDIPERRPIRVTDGQAKKLIEKISKCQTVSEFQALPPSTRDKCLKKLNEKGLSLRQTSRLTGIPLSIVRKNQA